MESDKQIQKRTYIDRALLIMGSVLLVSEIWKQWYLYAIVFDHHYRVWYFPFQLCSIPMYFCILRFFLNKENRKNKNREAISDRKPGGLGNAIDIFLQDFALLGGIAALMVPDGFTHPDHPLLTAHGYMWHVMLIMISLLVHFQVPRETAGSNQDGTVKKFNAVFLWKEETKKFKKSVKLFFILAAIAEGINVILHPFGDCDMFYISPYHVSSQPVFRNIDAIIGRGWGIFLYLFAVVLGAYIVHLLYLMLDMLVRKLFCR